MALNFHQTRTLSRRKIKVTNSYVNKLEMVQTISKFSMSLGLPLGWSFQNSPQLWSK